MTSSALSFPPATPLSSTRWGGGCTAANQLGGPSHYPYAMQHASLYSWDWVLGPAVAGSSDFTPGYNPLVGDRSKFVGAKWNGWPVRHKPALYIQRQRPRTVFCYVSNQVCSRPETMLV